MKEQWVKENKCWKMKLQESIKYVRNMRKHKMLKVIDLPLWHTKIIKKIPEYLCGYHFYPTESLTTV
jgi:hypothetical protein